MISVSGLVSLATRMENGFFFLQNLNYIFVAENTFFKEIIYKSTTNIHGVYSSPAYYFHKYSSFGFVFVVTILTQIFITDADDIISKNTSLMQLISIYFTYSKSLHVSGRTLPIIRRI